MLIVLVFSKTILFLARNINQIMINMTQKQFIFMMLLIICSPSKDGGILKRKGRGGGPIISSSRSKGKGLKERV